MGLDTSHDCWSSSYSSFNNFRLALARAAGYAVWKVKGDDGIHQDTVMLD